MNELFNFSVGFFFLLSIRLAHTLFSSFNSLVSLSKPFYSPPEKSKYDEKRQSLINMQTEWKTLNFLDDRHNQYTQVWKAFHIFFFFFVGWFLSRLWIDMSFHISARLSRCCCCCCLTLQSYSCCRSHFIEVNNLSTLLVVSFKWWYRYCVIIATIYVYCICVY